MSKLFCLSVTAILLGITACTPENKDTQKPPKTQSQPQTAAKNDPAPAASIEAKSAEAHSVPSRPAPPTAEKPAVATASPVVASAEKPASHATSGALTQDRALALAKTSGCLICHKIESKLVGPAWKDVGAKYRGDAKAAQTISANIRKGGSFGWKFGAMPPRGGGKISDTDIDNLAGFIASLK